MDPQQHQQTVTLAHYHWPGAEGPAPRPWGAQALIDLLSSQQISLYTHWRAAFRESGEPGSEFWFDPVRYDNKKWTPDHQNHTGTPAGFDGPICVDFEQPYWFPTAFCDHPQHAELYAPPRWQNQMVGLFTAVGKLLRRDFPDATVWVWGLSPMKDCNRDAIHAIYDHMDGVMLGTYLRSDGPVNAQWDSLFTQRVQAALDYRATRPEFRVWTSIWKRFKDVDQPIPIPLQQQHVQRMLAMGIDGISIFGPLLQEADFTAMLTAYVEIQEMSQ